MPALPRNVRILGVTSLLNDVAGEMVYPLLPVFLSDVAGGGKHWLGVMEGVADAVSSLLKLLAGYWSDRLGKRKGFIVAGYLLAAVARPMIALCRLPWQIVLVRTGDRLGKGLRTSPRDTLIAECTAPAERGRAFGFHRAMDHLGAAIGPALALLFLWLFPGQYVWLFAATAIPGVILVCVVAFGVHEEPRETVSPVAADHSTASTATLEKPQLPSMAPFSPSFRLYLVSLLIFSLGNSSDMFLLARSIELGVPKDLLPLLWGTFHLLKSYGTARIGRWIGRLGPRRLIIVGWLWFAAVYFAFAFATQAWHAWGLFYAYAPFYILTEASEKTLVPILAPKERLGLAFGWFHGILGAAALPASLLFGPLWETWGPRAAFGTGGGLALCATLLLLFVRLPPEATSPTSAS